MMRFLSTCKLRQQQELFSYMRQWEKWVYSAILKRILGVWSASCFNVCRLWLVVHTCLAMKRGFLKVMRTVSGPSLLYPTLIHPSSGLCLLTLRTPASCLGRRWSELAITALQGNASSFTCIDTQWHLCKRRKKKFLLWIIDEITLQQNAVRY